MKSLIWLKSRHILKLFGNNRWMWNQQFWFREKQFVISGQSGISLVGQEIKGQGEARLYQHIGAWKHHSACSTQDNTKCTSQTKWPSSLPTAKSGMDFFEFRCFCDIGRSPSDCARIIENLEFQTWQKEIQIKPSYEFLLKSNWNRIHICTKE